MRQWADVALLMKAKNLKGTFAVKLTADVPFMFEEGDEVALVPPRTDCPRRVTVEHAEQTDADRALVKFLQVDEPEVASALVGCHCLVRRELLDGEDMQGHPASWEGWTARDEASGLRGVVQGFEENAFQMLVEVVWDEGCGPASGKTTLVPVVDEFVRSVDPQSREIGLVLPNGLLEL